MDSKYDINDNYEHLDNNLEYILENILFEEENPDFNDDEYHKLKDLFNTLLINKCPCDETGQCSQSCCTHRNYIWDKSSNELVLCPETNTSDLIYECTAMCNCKPEKCLNRLVQYGPRKHLKIINSIKYHSKGVITTEPIPKGAFICEYAGELLTRKEAKRALRENELENKMNYVLCLKEMPQTTNQPINNSEMVIMTIVNPNKKGNIGRYLNHSCQPNCEIFSVRIDCPIPKIAIFAGRPIEPGEELCFHYNGGNNCNNLDVLAASGKILPCLCGSKNCTKYLPNVEI